MLTKKFLKILLLIHPPLIQTGWITERVDIPGSIIGTTADTYRRSTSIGASTRIPRSYLREPRRHNWGTHRDVTPKWGGRAISDVHQRPITHRCMQTVEDIPPNIERIRPILGSWNDAARVDDPKRECSVRS